MCTSLDAYELNRECAGTLSSNYILLCDFDSYTTIPLQCAALVVFESLC